MTTFLEAVGTATAAVLRRYPTNAVPPTPVYPYLVYSVAGDRAEGYTLDSRHGFRFYRIILQSFDKPSLASALDIDDKAVAGLLDKRLAVTGYDCGPCRLEVASAVVRDPDTTGVVSVTTTLTFTATKES